MTQTETHSQVRASSFKCLPLLQVSLLCLLICVFGLYALLRKKPRHGGEEGGVEYTPAVGNRHFMVRIPWKITSVEGTTIAVTFFLLSLSHRPPTPSLLPK